MQVSYRLDAYKEITFAFSKSPRKRRKQLKLTDRMVKIKYHKFLRNGNYVIRLLWVSMGFKRSFPEWQDCASIRNTISSSSIVRSHYLVSPPWLYISLLKFRPATVPFEKFISSPLSGRPPCNFINQQQQNSNYHSFHQTYNFIVPFLRWAPCTLSRMLDLMMLEYTL